MVDIWLTLASWYDLEWIDCTDECSEKKDIHNLWYLI
jgi:hypothetical protein